MAATEIELYKSDDSVIIDIPIDLEFRHGVEPCIHRVPRKLRKVNEAAYTPQFVSIGPFHHGRTEFLGMERHKGRYFDDFCERTGKRKADLKSFIHSRYEEIVQNYAGNVRFKKEDFLDMVLIDACFIIELFLKNSEYLNHDYILTTPWTNLAIKQDLILLENQLPYAFLKLLYEFATGDAETESETSLESDPLLPTQNERKTIHPFSKHTCKFFSYTKDFKVSEVDGIKHFTDLIRQVLIPKENFPSRPDVSCLYSAKKLDSAGVSFVPCQNGPLAELEVVSGKFNLFCIPCIPCLKSTELKLPEFKVQDETECFLRNVMALEQCLYPNKAYICNYIFLLDQLINNTEDVDLLVEKKIVKNLLGSNDAIVKLINKLCDEITVSNSCYYDISVKLKDHCDNTCNKTKAKIKREYFKDWWTGSTAIVGFFVLFFSVSATIKTLFFN